MPRFSLTPTPSRRGLVLAAVCLSAFAINVDTTIVNVALPSLTRHLGAGTRQLQWIVDAYNLAFAALVLAAGSLGDRFGRRPALIIGLIGFAASSLVGAFCGSPGELIAVRVLMGAFAALIFPTTLSIITNSFPERASRAKAVGIWGAVTGLGVAIGPVTGGLLLQLFSWQSVFVALVPVALLAAVMVARVVPESSDPDAPGVDRPGLLTASAASAVIVYTIIQGPSQGWGSAMTLGGFGLALALACAFVGIERRVEHPMIDVRLFSERAFTAASGSVTLAFFSLFGFIFLITQYMQFVRGWGPLSAGARTLPVAITIGASSVIGAGLANRLGTRAIVMSGLGLLGASFLWISQAGTLTPYPVIVVQMALMGSGMGFVTAPATESILSVLPAGKAGVGSAVNDATREMGGTLGVAIVGSVFTSLYASHLVSALRGAPPHVVALARDSVGAGYAVAANAPATAHAAVLHAVQGSFMAGLHTACLVSAGVCALGVVGSAALPGRRARREVPEATHLVSVRAAGAVQAGSRAVGSAV